MQRFHDAPRACCRSCVAFQNTGKILECSSVVHDVLGKGKNGTAHTICSCSRSQESVES